MHVICHRYKATGDWALANQKGGMSFAVIVGTMRDAACIGSVYIVRTISPCSGEMHPTSRSFVAEKLWPFAFLIVVKLTPTTASQ